MHERDAGDHGAPIDHSGHAGSQGEHAGHEAGAEEQGVPKDHSGHAGSQREHAGHEAGAEEQGVPVDHSGHAGSQGEQAGHGADAGSHGAHVDHTGHELMFRNRFWVCLVLAIPVLLYSSTIQGWLDFTMPTFSGSTWVTPIFSVIIFLYGGLPFLRMAPAELRQRQPGMMTLITVSLNDPCRRTHHVEFAEDTGGADEAERDLSNHAH